MFWGHCPYQRHRCKGDPSMETPPLHTGRPPWGVHGGGSARSRSCPFGRMWTPLGLGTLTSSQPQGPFPLGLPELNFMGFQIKRVPSGARDIRCPCCPWRGQRPLRWRGSWCRKAEGLRGERAVPKAFLHLKINTSRSHFAEMCDWRDSAPVASASDSKLGKEEAAPVPTDVAGLSGGREKGVPEEVVPSEEQG